MCQYRTNTGGKPAEERGLRSEFNTTLAVSIIVGPPHPTPLPLPYFVTVSKRYFRNLHFISNTERNICIAIFYNNFKSSDFGHVE